MYDEEILTAAIAHMQTRLDYARGLLADLKGKPRNFSELTANLATKVLLPITGEAAGHAVEKKTKILPEAPKKRLLSPEARKRIADAQKRRWAAYNKSKGKK